MGGSAHSHFPNKDGSSPNVLFGHKIHTDSFLWWRGWEFASGGLVSRFTYPISEVVFGYCPPNAVQLHDPAAESTLNCKSLVEK
jgi:hypothetical protein